MNRNEFKSGKDFFVFCKFPLFSTLLLLTLPYRCSCVPEYACCVNELRHKVGLQTWIWVILRRHMQRISSNKTTISRCFILEFRRGHPIKQLPGHHQQCCSGSGFLESDPAELWDFFGSGAGLDIIFAQARSGSGLSKTFWTLCNFFAFCFLPAKILLITWEFWCWMMWFILFFNLSRMADFHTAVVRWRESHELQSPTAKAIACIVRHVSKVGVLSRQARNQHSKSCLMYLCVFSQLLVEIGLANTN